MSKVILIGVDGATPQLVEPWINQGKLPNLQNIKKNGSWGKLNSTIPPFSAPAWTSIVTGCNPGKHGVYGFESTGTLNPHLINSRYRKKPAFWNYLTKIGKKSIIVNVPGTYPPEKINGIVITGLLTPSYDSNFIYPNDLKERLTSDDLGSYELEQFWVEDFSRSKMKKRDPVKLLDHINKQMESRAKVAINLMKEFEWDFSMIVFRGTDTAQHFLFDETDLLLSCYKKVDELIGNIMKSFPDSHIFIVSDHGFDLIDKIFYPDNVLYNNGFLTPINDPFIDFKSRFNIILFRFLNWVLKLLPLKFLKNSKSIRKILFSGASKSKLIDFSKTKAFSTADGRGIQLCFDEKNSNNNDKRKDYDETCNEIIKIFNSLKDPVDNNKIIDKIYRSDDIYGINSVSPPDLVFTLNKGITASEWIRFPNRLNDFLKYKERDIKFIFNKDLIGRCGDHAQYGVFFAYGQDIRSDYEVKGLSVEDVLPMVLTNLGLSIPNDIDGKVKKEIFVKMPKIKNISWNDDLNHKVILSKSELDKINKIRNMLKNKKS